MAELSLVKYSVGGTKQTVQAQPRPGAGSSVARTILAADSDTPKDILFRQLDWPSLRWRRTILSMTLFHQLVHHG